MKNLTLIFTLIILSTLVSHSQTISEVEKTDDYIIKLHIVRYKGTVVSVNQIINGYRREPYVCEIPASKLDNNDVVEILNDREMLRGWSVTSDKIRINYISDEKAGVARINSFTYRNKIFKKHHNFTEEIRLLKVL
jgi:hypothetical protein